MSKKEDTSNDHLTWIVENRSKNQATSLRLHRLMETYEKQINDDKEGARIVFQNLVGICFSLWRAVFLADVEPSAIIGDSYAFLGKLILDNAINYPQDRAARAWTFVYYLQNVRYRLQEMCKIWPELGEYGQIKSLGPKGTWVHMQNQTDAMISQLELALKEKGSLNVPLKTKKKK